VNKSILLGCYEVPGYGGASTATYSLFEKMQRDGYPVHYWNLIEDQDVEYYQYIFGADFGNPKQLKNVHTIPLQLPMYRPHCELSERIAEMKPDVMIGSGFIAAHLMKKSCPAKTTIFLTTGCQQMKDIIILKRARDFIELKRKLSNAIGRPEIVSREEEAAVDLCDLTITHSGMTQFLYEKFFPFHTGKIYSDVIWFAEWIYEDALEYNYLKKPFEQRSIDALFISSSWSRQEKGLDLVKKLLYLLNGMEVHLVGDIEEKDSLPAVCHGVMRNRTELFTLFGNAKTIICTSSFDAAPGILFEGSAMDCNLVASKNCGNWEICNNALLVDPFLVENFATKIRLGKDRRYPDQMEQFLQRKSYQNLMETISVLD
jgi:hypothetical protein